MIHLINGRGQLGEALARRLRARQVYDIDWDIYHTWNHVDKRKEVQEKELEKFIEYVDENRDKNIAFISTKHKTADAYFLNKLRAEEYLLTKTNTGKVMRLPYMAGIGICQRIKDGTYLTPGTLEISTLDIQAENVLQNLYEPKRLFHFDGDVIDIRLLKELIDFRIDHE
jgi:hypothetical protein